MLASVYWVSYKPSRSAWIVPGRLPRLCLCLVNGNVEAHSHSMHVDFTWCAWNPKASNSLAAPKAATLINMSTTFERGKTTNYIAWVESTCFFEKHDFLWNSQITISFKSNVDTSSIRLLFPCMTQFRCLLILRSMIPPNMVYEGFVWLPFWGRFFDAVLKRSKSCCLDSMSIGLCIKESNKLISTGFGVLLILPCGMISHTLVGVSQ